MGTDGGVESLLSEQAGCDCKKEEGEEKSKIEDNIFLDDDSKTLLEKFLWEVNY